MDSKYLLWLLPFATGIIGFFLKDVFKNNATQKDLVIQDLQTDQNTKDIQDLKSELKLVVKEKDIQLITLEMKQITQNISRANNKYNELHRKFEENNKFIQDNFVTKEMFELQMKVLTEQNANIDKKQDHILTKLDNLK